MARKQRSHSIEFKRQVAQEFVAGETLYGLYFPDWMVRPTSISVAVVINSTNANYTVQHTLDYTGGSSAFISSNANWFASSGIVAATSNGFTVYTYPVSAIQLNSTGGSSQGILTWTVMQAG